MASAQSLKVTGFSRLVWYLFNLWSLTFKPCHVVSQVAGWKRQTSTNSDWRPLLWVHAHTHTHRHTQERGRVSWFVGENGNSPSVLMRVWDHMLRRLTVIVVGEFRVCWAAWTHSDRPHTHASSFSPSLTCVWQLLQHLVIAKIKVQPIRTAAQTAGC